MFRLDTFLFDKSYSDIWLRWTWTTAQSYCEWTRMLGTLNSASVNALPSAPPPLFHPWILVLLLLLLTTILLHLVPVEVPSVGVVVFAFTLKDVCVCHLNQQSSQARLQRCSQPCLHYNIPLPTKSFADTTSFWFRGTSKYSLTICGLYLLKRSTSVFHLNLIFNKSTRIWKCVWKTAFQEDFNDPTLWTGWPYPY